MPDFDEANTSIDPTLLPPSDRIVFEDARKRAWIVWGLSLPLLTLSFAAAIYGVLCKPGDPMGWVMLVFFGGVGISLLLALARMASLRRKFGLARFEPLVDGAVGGQLVGTILTGRAIRFAQNVRLTLACTNRRIVGTPRSSSVVESIEWSDSHILSGDLPGDSEGTEIPVCFDIPSRCSPTERITGRDQIIWKLTADSTAEGSPFHIEFTLTVYQMASKFRVDNHAARYRVESGL